MTNSDIKLLMKILTDKGVDVDLVVDAFQDLESEKHYQKLETIAQQGLRYDNRSTS